MLKETLLMCLVLNYTSCLCLFPSLCLALSVVCSKTWSCVYSLCLISVPAYCLQVVARPALVHSGDIRKYPSYTVTWVTNWWLFMTWLSYWEVEGLVVQLQASSPSLRPLDTFEETLEHFPAVVVVTNNKYCKCSVGIYSAVFVTIKTGNREHSVANWENCLKI